MPKNKILIIVSIYCFVCRILITKKLVFKKADAVMRSTVSFQRCHYMGKVKTGQAVVLVQLLNHSVVLTTKRFLAAWSTTYNIFQKDRY